MCLVNVVAVNPVVEAHLAVDHLVFKVRALLSAHVHNLLSRMTTAFHNARLLVELSRLVLDG